MRTNLRERDGIREKKCSKCGKWLELEKHFKPRQLAHKMGWRSECIECGRIMRRKASIKYNQRIAEQRQELWQAGKRKEQPNNYIVVKMPGCPEMKGNMLYRDELRNMVKDGYCPPGTVVMQQERKYVVCNDGRKWREFRDADWSLDYKMPAGELRAI